MKLFLNQEFMIFMIYKLKLLSFQLDTEKRYFHYNQLFECFNNIKF